MSMLREWLAYGDWAWARLLAAAAPLDHEALARSLPPGERTLLGLMHHLWGAERVWLDRWQGKPQPRFPEIEPGLRVARLRELGRSIAAERAEFLFQAGAAAERQPIAYRNSRGQDLSYVLGDMMLHVANHGIHHRAQVVGHLRRLGVAAPRIDYLHLRLEQPTLRPDPDSVARLQAAGLVVGEEPVEPPPLELATLLDYFRYADWAQGRVLDAAMAVRPERLETEHGFGPGGIRATLAHIAAAEAYFLDRWQGHAESAFTPLPPEVSLAGIAGSFAEAAEARNALLAAAGDEGLLAPLEATGPGGARLPLRLGETALQLCGHGTHHRAQVVDMLRLSGGEAPEIDYLDWIDQR